MISFFSYDECIFHLDQLVALNNHCFPDSSWGENIWRTILTQRGFVVVVYRKNNRILAYLLLTYLINEAEMYKIGVQQNSRNQGIAQQLLDAACHRLRNSSIKQLFLEVRADNIAATRFYQKNDFETVGLRKRYYNSPSCDGILLRKYLE
jgi:ribosomal-protein-alanine N-acetyltransferase